MQNIHSYKDTLKINQMDHILDYKTSPPEF